MRLNRQIRKGTSAVEAAVVSSVVMLFIMGLIIGAVGVFRYDELASLSRRGARYASVHGSLYAKETGNTAATPSDVFSQAIVPHAVALDRSRLNYSVAYTSSNALYEAKVVNGNVVGTTNTVTVTLTYQWVPEAFLGGITLSSTSTMPMSY